MSEAYLIGAARGSVQSLSADTRVDQVLPMLKSLFDKAGAAPRRVQELHWHGGDDEYWLSGLIPGLGLVPDLARFHWPLTSLLPHAVLHSSTRAIELGERDLIMLAQESFGQVQALLLASPVTVGRYNIAPRARLGLRLALSSAEDGVFKAASVALEKADEAAARQEEAEAPPKVGPLGETLPAEKVDRKDMPVGWLASARRPDADAVQAAFPGAQWLVPEDDMSGELFLLDRLVDQLEKSKQPRGLLVTDGPQRTSLVTLVERLGND